MGEKQFTLKKEEDARTFPGGDSTLQPSPLKFQPPESALPYVLLLDDIASIRLLFAKLLDSMGIRVLATGSETEAFCLLRNGEARFLIQDFTRGPGSLGGARFTALLRSRPETKSVPIVMITGTGAGPVARQMAGIGLSTTTDLVAFLEKPVDLETVKGLARSVIEPVLRR